MNVGGINWNTINNTDRNETPEQSHEQWTKRFGSEHIIPSKEYCYPFDIGKLKFQPFVMIIVKVPY